MAPERRGFTEPERRRYTEAEWREIDAEYRRRQIERAVRQMYPDPQEECDLGPFVPIDPSPPRRQPAPVPASQHPPHLADWLASLSKADVEKLEKLVHLRAETVAWIEGKNERELKNLDGAVEFITSSRTAAKVLMWVGGMAVAFVGGVAALAKNGIDLFSMLRGGR
ncbi:MAG: hypothetical protein WAP03_00925 [Methylorubrum rhodinum]|uniref:hypothetical protein n=1 Tax=Methylorubrum rhodinum TaxID=29428 RepID=UPI003BB0A581